MLAGHPACWICGRRVATELDHIVPLAQGGDPFAEWNLRPACKSCNASKASRVRNELLPRRPAQPPRDPEQPPEPPDVTRLKW